MPYFKPCFLKLFNLIFTHSSYPELWTTGYINNIYKSADPCIPANYRGITIASTMGKLFNIILNKRLEKYLIENKIINPYQIGFLSGYRTSDHIFTLKTIIDKYLKKEKKKLYLCFVDFRKAFDRVWHCGLLYKLQKVGISGLFYNIIKNMYTKVKVCVKTPQGLTPKFNSNIGVRQGDVLSPLLFNIFINDIPELFKNCSNNVSLENFPVPCLSYADDLVLISTCPQGLQDQINQLQQYCDTWCIDINTNKTKIMTISTGKNIKRENYLFGGTEVEQVVEYKYLGIIINSKGEFSNSKTDLANKSLKAYFKLCKSFHGQPPSAKTFFHIFDHTVKPILTYGSEVIHMFNLKGRNFTRNVDDALEKTFEGNKLEKVHLMSLRYILGVHNKVAIDALYGETGRLPIYIDIICNMMKYYERLINFEKDSLIYKSYMCSTDMQNSNISSWFSNIKHIMNLLQVKTQTKKSNLSKTYINIQEIKKKLINRFCNNWEKRINNDQRRRPDERNKLRTYRTFKPKMSPYKMETYVTVLPKQARSEYCKFRISAHKLNIEILRYKGIKPEKRLCTMCADNKVEDELHFFMQCSKYQTNREILLQKIWSKYPSLKTLNDHDQFIWLMTNEDADIIHLISQFLTHNMNVRNK